MHIYMNEGNIHKNTKNSPSSFHHLPQVTLSPMKDKHQHKAQGGSTEKGKWGTEGREGGVWQGEKGGREKMERERWKERWRVWAGERQGDGREGE